MNIYNKNNHFVKHCTLTRSATHSKFLFTICMASGVTSFRSRYTFTKNTMLNHAHIDHTRGWLILCNQHVSGKTMIIAEGHRFLRINTKLSVAASFTPVKKLCKSFSCLTCISVWLFTCLSFCWLRSPAGQSLHESLSITSANTISLVVTFTPNSI